MNYCAIGIKIGMTEFSLGQKLDVTKGVSDQAVGGTTEVSLEGCTIHPTRFKKTTKF